MIKKIVLEKDEYIGAVVPENAFGPGWFNEVIWVYVINPSKGTYRLESIQPNERTKELDVLFSIGESINSKLINSIPVIRNN